LSRHRYYASALTAVIELASASRPHLALSVELRQGVILLEAGGDVTASPESGGALLFSSRLT